MTRLRLEPIGPQHAEAIQRLIEHDREILENTRAPDPYPPDGARTFVARALAEKELIWVVLGDDGEPVGACGLIRHPDSAELGYWVGAGHRGRGVATAAARELVRIATEDLGFRTVVARTRARNEASRRVLENAGLELVAVRPNAGDEAKWRDDEPMADYRLTVAAT